MPQYWLVVIRVSLHFECSRALKMIQVKAACLRIGNTLVPVVSGFVRLLKAWRRFQTMSCGLILICSFFFEIQSARQACHY